MNAARLPMVEALPAATLRTTFSMWSLGQDGSESQRIELVASTLDEAAKLATPPMMKAALAKSGFAPFVILETNDAEREGRARHRLHFYTVKAKREFRPRGPFGSAELTAVPYAVYAGALAMEAFEPRRPFDAMLDDPANGRQPGEGRLIDIKASRR